MKSRSMRFALAVVLFVSLLLTACGQTATVGSNEPGPSPTPSPTPSTETNAGTAPGQSNETPAPLKKISISIPSKSVVFLPLYLGIEKGMYAEEGIELEISVLKASAAVAAAISGEVPYTGSLGSTFRSTITGNSNLKVVMITLDNLAFSLFGDKNATSIQDLKGKVVMVTNTTGSDNYVLKKMLEQEGLDPTTFLNVVSSSTTGNSFQGLMGGAAQGAMLSPPFTQMAEKEGYHRLANAIDIVKRANAGISVTSAYLEKNKEEVTKVLRATLKSMDYIRNNPEESIALISKLFELDPDLAKGAYEDTVVLYSDDGTIEDEVFMEEIKEILAETNSTKQMQVSDAVDFSIVRSLAK